MAAKYAKIGRVGKLKVHVPLFKISEITILFWNINNFKTIKKSKKCFLIFFSPKIQFTIELHRSDQFLAIK